MDDPKQPVPTSPLPPIAPADTAQVPATDIPVNPPPAPATTPTVPEPVSVIPEPAPTEVQGEEPKKEETPGEGTPPAATTI